MRLSWMHALPLTFIAAWLMMAEGCAMEPPLRLPDSWDGTMKLGEVVTELNVVWDIEADWRSRWWYGWDEKDIERWGDLTYPVPTTFEGRFFHFGETVGDTWLSLQPQTITETTFRRQFEYGYHDVLIWSNIDSKDGTQVVTVDESDPANIFASTSRTRVGYARTGTVHNNPEIFYSSSLDKIYISRDTADYDYFDPVHNAWVKQFHTEFSPLVYIYLVQVVIYNNHERIVGLTDNSVINSVANGVTINSGHTSNEPVTVTYEMKLKKGLPARNGLTADIFGGKFHTFGLCDMDRWDNTRGPEYNGSRTDLRNKLTVSFQFANATDSVYQYDVTPQLRKQSHGGVITIEIDADTLTMPTRSYTGSMFDPTVEPTEDVIHEVTI